MCVLLEKDIRSVEASFRFFFGKMMVYRKSREGTNPTGSSAWKGEAAFSLSTGPVPSQPAMRGRSVRGLLTYGWEDITTFLNLFVFSVRTLALEGACSTKSML